MSYNPKFKEAFTMASNMYNKHSEEIDRFVFDYKLMEFYDQNGYLCQQLTPFLLIDFKK